MSSQSEVENGTPDETTEVNYDPKDERKISRVYFGYLVGRVREVLESVITDKDQLQALTGVMIDRMFDWWKKSTDHNK